MGDEITTSNTQFYFAGIPIELTAGAVVVAAATILALVLLVVWLLAPKRPE